MWLRFCEAARRIEACMDCLRLGQELVLVNHRGHGYFAVAIVHSNYFAFAAHANAFSQGDFRGESQSEFDQGTGSDGRVQIEANPARTYIPGLSTLFLRSIVGISDRNGQA